MVAYNEKIDFETVSEKELLQKLSQAEDDLRDYGVSFSEISSIQENQYNMDLESNVAEVWLKELLVCLYDWWYRAYMGFLQYRKQKSKNVELNKEKDIKFAAIKLIECLLNQNQIDECVYRNIVKENAEILI